MTKTTEFRDVLYKKIGGQGSVGPDLRTWLQAGAGSDNASGRALTGFLQDLGTFRPAGGFGHFTVDAERLDPLQSLFILRVLTEDMGVPLRKALAKKRTAIPSAEDASSVGPLLAVDAAPQESEAPGWSEDAYVSGVTGIYDSVTKILGLGDKSFGKYSEKVGQANAISSIVKFIATYVMLKGEMRLEEPGQPLIRTKNTRPGDGTRTVVARFFIDGQQVTDWMKDHRQLVALAGLDLDMPKTGALKGVRTEWLVKQSTDPRKQLIQPLDGTGSLYGVRTNDKGEASVTFTGNRQERDLDPKKVMPVEKVVRITVTPQIKATEMQQDLVDAVVGAIGISGIKWAPDKAGNVEMSGNIGFLTPLMETLYRMNWTGEIHFDLRVRDWQQAETMGQLTVEIKATGREFKKEYALQMTLDRSLVFIDTEMRVVGAEMPAAPDQEFLKSIPAEQRALMQSQMEAYAKQMGELAKNRDFYGTGPGTARMSFNDLTSLKMKTVEQDMTRESADMDKWTASQEFEVSSAAPYFTVKVDLDKKTASVTFVAQISVQHDGESRVSYTSPGYPRIESESKPPSKKVPMEIFSDLNSPVQGGYVQGLFPVGGAIVIPLKEEPVIDGGGAMNYYGAIPIPFTFGPKHQFKGSGLLSYSITRKVVKAK